MLRIPLRNLVAHRGIAALADPAAARAFEALVEFALRVDDAGRACVDDECMGHLVSEDEVFETGGDGGVRLRDEHVASAAEFAERAARMERAVGSGRCGPAPFDWGQWHRLPGKGAPVPDAAALGWSLCAAALLFDHALYFEAHEVLEPVWLRSRGVEKSFLKGLIQVAVGLHHFGNGNLAGARKLLEEGSGRLRPLGPSVKGVQLRGFLDAIDACLIELRAVAPSSLSAPPRLSFDL